jgi:transcriptional regulator with XRE-family HTH domain
MDLKDTLRETLIEERKKHKMTQQEVADYLNMARGAYAQYETGKNVPPVTTLTKIAELYKCSVDYLLGRFK